MKNKLIYILKIFLILILLTFIFITLLGLSALIPSKLIKNNTLRSLDVLKQEGCYPIRKNKFVLDNFTDALMLNTSYSVDYKQPLKSIILNQSAVTDNNSNPIKSLDDALNNSQNSEFIEYSRYWHGYLIYLRPLLLIGDYSVVRLILLITINILSIYTVYLIYKNINIKYAIIFAITLLSISIYIMGLSMQYSSVFIITLLSCIYLLKKKEKIKDINVLFCIIGATTCFMDLLTSPMISFCIPLILYFLLNSKQEGDNIKEVIKKIIKLGTFWVIGYGGIWLLKWAVSDCLFNAQTIKNSFKQILIRSSKADYINVTTKDTIIKNVVHVKPYLIISFIGTVLSFIIALTKNNKLIKKELLRMNIPYILIGIMPFVWYIIVKNHSYIHAFFTFKNLCITIFCLLIIFINNLSIYEKMKSKEKKMDSVILKNFEFGKILKKLKNKDIFLITSVIYFAIVLLYELFYCNFRFFTGMIQSYNFSLYRIVIYCVIYLIYYKVKDKFINSAVETLNSKVKCYFIDMIIVLTVLLSIVLLFIAIKNLSVNIIIAFISLLIFNLFAIYISNNLINNAIITALLFGSICSISITFNNQLDEKRHFLAGYSIALGEFNLNSPKVDKSIINMPRMMNANKFIKYFEQEPTKEITKEFSKEKTEDTPCDYLVASHIVSGIGIFISKTLGRKYCRYIYNRKNI